MAVHGADAGAGEERREAAGGDAGEGVAETGLGVAVGPGPVEEPSLHLEAVEAAAARRHLPGHVLAPGHVDSLQRVVLDPPHRLHQDPGARPHVRRGAGPIIGDVGGQEETSDGAKLVAPRRHLHHAHGWSVQAGRVDAAGAGLAP